MAHHKNKFGLTGKDQLFVSLILVGFMGVHQLGKKLEQHTMDCTAKSATLIKVVVGVGVIVLAELVMKFLNLPMSSH